MRDIKSRLRYVLDTHYSGNSSEMARCLNVTHTTISNYIEKNRTLRSDFLLAMANDIGISPNWLLLGIGEKYLKHSDVKSGTNYFNLGTGEKTTQIINHKGSDNESYFRLKIETFEEKVKSLEKENQILSEFNNFLKKSLSGTK